MVGRWDAAGRGAPVVPVNVLQDGEILRVSHTNLQQPVALCVRQEGGVMTAVIEELMADEYARAVSLCKRGSPVLISEIKL